MKKIGFETTAYKTENYLPAIVEKSTEMEQEPNVMSLEDAMKQVGWEKAQKLVFEFLFVSKCGNQHRLTQQLMELKSRFFAPL